MSKDWGLCELLPFKKHWEWESAAVLRVNFLNFNGVVTKEEVKTVELLTTIVTAIIPENLEGKDFAVIVKETL